MVFILSEAQQQKRPPKRTNKQKHKIFDNTKLKKSEQEWLELVEAF